MYICFLQSIFYTLPKNQTLTKFSKMSIGVWAVIFVGIKVDGASIKEEKTILVPTGHKCHKRSTVTQVKVNCCPQCCEPLVRKETKIGYKSFVSPLDNNCVSNDKRADLDDDSDSDDSGSEALEDGAKIGEYLICINGDAAEYEYYLAIPGTLTETDSSRRKSRRTASIPLANIEQERAKMKAYLEMLGLWTDTFGVHTYLVVSY